jgi:hypothetical protein
MNLRYDTKHPKTRRKELITHYHNLIQDIGGELGQEILVSILARHCALFAVNTLLKDKHPTEDFNETYYYWEEVEHEIENYEE